MSEPAKSDGEILKAVQSGIPLVSRPFKVLSERLGLEEDFLIDRVRALGDRGIVRRLAVSFNSRSLGFSSTLVAARAVEGGERQAIELVNSFEEVTHNYRRTGADLDIWFTLITPSRRSLEEILARLEESGHFDRLVELPATRVFKIDVRLARPGGKP